MQEGTIHPARLGPVEERGQRFQWKLLLVLSCCCCCCFDPPWPGQVQHRRPSLHQQYRLARSVRPEPTKTGSLRPENDPTLSLEHVAATRARTT
jgi:hypothetical protein